MQLSVIICTLNRQNIIQRTLYALSQSHFPRGEFEVIVVDNGSMDHTRAIAQSFDGQLQIVYLRETQRGKFNALNRGVANAASDRIILLDDDMLVEPDLLQVYADAFDANPDIALFGGPVDLSLPPGHDRDLVSIPQVRMVLAQSEYGDREHFLRWPDTPVGGNMAVRRDLLGADLCFEPIDQQGFTMELALEDILFFRRVMQRGYRVMYLPRARGHHIVRDEQLRLSYFMQRHAHALIGQEILDEVPPTRQWFRVPRYHLKRLARRVARFIKSVPASRRKRLAAYVDMTAAWWVVRYYQKRA
jgi:glycosyltransferase involved in cell wall biosynthesis